MNPNPNISAVRPHLSQDKGGRIRRGPTPRGSKPSTLRSRLNPNYHIRCHLNLGWADYRFTKQMHKLS